VRGFPASSLIGTRAASASAEYRIPLVRRRFSAGSLPFFLQRSSVSVWGDYGSAWCPDVGADREVCDDPLLAERLSIASLGAELNVFTGVLTWDQPYRLRLGAAFPRHVSPGLRLPKRSFYLTAGLSF
jgi:hemolysin activation/secretion protein